MPLSRAALLLLTGAVVAAAALPEFSGFFTESKPGVYETRGVRLSVTAGSGGVSFRGVELRHRGAKAVSPAGVEATGAVVRTYGAGQSRTSPAFRAVEYREIYPGVTLRLSFDGRAVKADYVVAPGADPRAIAFRYEGVRATVTADGELVAGPLRQPAPTVLQGSKKLAARYAIGRDNWVRFVIEPHDPAAELLIDPYVLTASAYFGGGRADRITAMATDAAGYIYLAGATESTDFPDPSLRAISGGVEAYILKIHPATLQVVYATYLGGMGDDRALGIAVDSSGSAYVAGVTASSDFPALPWSGGASDGFLVRLDASGALMFGTMLGGGGADSANSVALSADGSAWIAGETTSADLTLTGVPYQGAYRGGSDVMLAKVSSSGAIVSMGYFGGSGDDRATAATVDSSGELYFTGGTTSGQFFPLANAYSSYKGGQDAFIAKLSGDGRTLRYSTYLGGTGGVPGQPETGNWIGVDATGIATVVGTTGSSDFPVAASPAQALFGGGATDAFVARLSAAGNALLYSSFFGGNSTEEGLAGAYGSDGAFYLAGATASAGLPAPEAFQSMIGGDIDGFFAKLSSNLTSKLAFSYVGAAGIESVTGLAATSTGLIVVGNSSSTSWLASGTPKGLYDGWIMLVTETGMPIQMNSSPAGIEFTVSGTGCTPTSAITPATLSWRSGSSCTVSFAGMQGSADTRYVFQSWNDGNTSNPRTFTASSAATYSMSFVTQHWLTRAAMPAAGGTVSAADGFYAAGSPVTLTAAANTGYEFAGWSGSVMSNTNPLSLAMDGPKEIQANFHVRTTFTSTVAVQITITGTGCSAGTYTTPATVSMTSAAVCSVSFPGTLTSGGVRSVFSRWSDGPTSNSRSITASAPATYSLEWSTEYLLTRLMTGSGTVSGSDGYYAASATVQLTATPATGYQFVNWSGDATGTANPLSIIMTGPKSITANFTLRTATVNIGTNVAGVQFSVSGSGCAAATHTAPASFTWAEGMSCTIATSAIQGGDTRWLFERWTDGNTSSSRTITATAPSVSYTLQFATEHRLTRLVSGSGTVSGADGFYAAGSSISLTATPAEGYQFTSWSGNGSSTANPLVFTMTAPVAVTANFSTAPVAVSIAANVAGAQFSVTGSGCPAGTYTAPTQVTWTNGTACSIAAASPQGGPDTRLVFTQWADGSVANPRSITAQPGASASLVFTTEHKLTRTVSGQGSVSGTDGFYAAGSTVSLTATPVTGYQFAGWSGGASGIANPVSLTMNGPVAVTATFTAAPVGVRIEANTATAFQVSGSGCPTGSYTAPTTVTWTNGTACTIAVTSPQGGSASRQVFTGWADSSTANPRTITASPGAVYTIAMAAEHYLTRTVSGNGSISGSDGFYAAGSTLQLTATPQAGYAFTGWSGSATGAANPLSVVMDTPKTVTASFAAASIGIRFESNVTTAISVSGAGCPAGAYTTPVTLNWATGSACTITAQVPSATTDTRWVFTNWNDGPTTASRAITASPGAVYGFVVGVEYRLTRGVSGSGSVSGSDGFYASGTSVQLSATAQSGYQFTGWSGSATGAANPLTITIDGPKSVVAMFAAAPTPVSIDSNVAAVFSVSGPAGCPIATYTAPTTVSWPSGTSCTVAVATPQGDTSTRSVFVRWADGSTASSRSLTATAGASYGIVMAVEHALVRTVSGAGSVSGSDGFQAAGATVQLSATPQAGYQFAGWAGAASGTANPLTLVMDGPKSMVAQFTPAAVSVRLESNIGGAQFTVSGAGCPAGTYTAPANLSWLNASGCVINVASPVGGPDSRSVFSGWADGSGSNPRTVVASPGAVYTFVLATEHRLTRGVSGPGSVSGADGFRAAGSTVQLTATAQLGYQFAGWTGSITGSANPVSVVMDGPKSVTANFTSATTSVRFMSNVGGTQFTVSGSGCPAGTYTAAVDLVWAYGVACSVAVVSPQGGSDTRYVFAGWADGPTANTRTITASSGAVYTLNFNTEHRLTCSVSGSGTVSGADGFYGAGTFVEFTATSAAGQQFTGWSGTGGGSANPLSIRMDGPTTLIANFAPIPRAGIEVESMSPLVGAGASGTFTATFSHGGGSSELYLGYMLFLPTSNVVQYTAKGSCLIEYNRISNGMRLIDDPGTGWLGPISGVPLSPVAGTLSNSQCSVNLSTAKAVISTDKMTVTVAVTFRNGASPVMATFLQGVDVKDNWTGMTQFGNWVYSGGTSRPGPGILGVAASTTEGTYAVYSVTANHTIGAAWLSMIHVLVSDRIVGGTPCQAVYFPLGNTLDLINDTGTALVSGAVGVAPGTPGTLANSRCSINTGLASRSVTDKSVTVTVPTNFQVATFGGMRNVYVNAFDIAGQLSHWVQASTLNVR